MHSIVCYHSINEFENTWVFFRDENTWGVICINWHDNTSL